MSYTISYIRHRRRHSIRCRMRYPFLLPLRFIQPVLPHRLRAFASGFQLPCVLNTQHASASSPLHPPLRSFWGTPSRSSTSRRQLVQHGNTILLHAAVWSERDWFKCAEEHQRNFPVGVLVLRLASGAQAAREE